MMSKDDLVDGVNFIFTECHRLQEFMAEDIKSIGNDDAFCMLPHPGGRGHMICGRNAYRELQKMAAYASQRAGMQQRVALDKVTNVLGDVLVARFLGQRLPIDIRQIDLAFNAAIKEATKKVADRTHFVPCHLMSASEPSELAIGPVSFLNRKSFRRFIRHTRSQQRGLQKAQKDHKLARDLLYGGLIYYRSFDWVAKVDVNGCDEKEGDRLAKRTVTAALDCLHLILGGGSTDRMKVGGPRISTDRRAKLRMSPDGELHTSASRSWMGQVGFREGWSKHLLRDEVQQIFFLCGVSLEAAVNPDLKRPLSRRFLDATLWYGQGVREESPAASVVKFVTALERMLMTEEREDIGNLLAERLSAICTIAYQGQNYKTRQEWFVETKKAYNLRSKLVHGSMSPESAEVTKGVYSCMKLTEAALRSLVCLLNEKELRQEKLSSKQLAKMFDAMVVTANGIENLTSSETAPSEVSTALR